MKKGKRRLLYLLLLVAVASLVLVLTLPTLIRANIASRLDAAGLRLEEFELAGPGLAETHIQRARIAGDDGSRYDIDNLVATYSLSGLMLGRLEQVTAEQLSIQPSTQTQPLTELLQALFGLMEEDINTAMPVDRLHLERIRFALGDKRQLDASFSVQKRGRELVAEMRFDTPDRPLLRFSQQQAGRWLLEASNREEDAFAAALYDRSKEQPLVLSVESDLARIREWTTLFGIPFPAHNAVTRGTLRLKPDITQREAVFAIDGTATGIDEPGLQIASADTAIEGRLQWHDDSPDIDITGNASLTMTQLRRPELQADRLLFDTTGRLTITQHGLNGHFDPDTRIESEQFALATIETGSASLVTTAEQRFEWERATGTWRFNESRYRARLDKGGLPPFRIENGDYALSHAAWRFPLEGRTGFSLEGSSSQAGDGMLTLQNLKHRLSGSIAWPTTKQDLTLALDIDATADEMQAASLAATQLSARGGLSLLLAKTATRVAIEPDFRLAAAAIRGDQLAVDAARLVVADPLSLQLTETGVELSAESHTPLTLSLSAGSIGSGGSTAESASLVLEGRLETPAPGTLDVAGTLRLEAAKLVHGASRASSLEARGEISLVHEANSWSASLEPGFSARMASLRSHDLAMEQAEVTTQQALPLLPLEGFALAGSYRIDHSALTHPDFRLESGSASLDIDAATDDGSIAGRLLAESQSIRIDGQAWNATGHAANFLLSPSNLAIEGSLTLGNTGSDIGYVLDQDLQQEKGELRFTSKSQGVRALSSALLRLGAPVPRELQLLSGSASAAGTATWGDKLEKITADIRLSNTGGRYGEAWFSGLAGNVDVTLYPEIKGSSRSFSIPVIDLGIPVTNLKGRFTFSKAAERQPVVILDNLRAAMFGGTLSASRIRLDLNRRSNSFTLAFRDVSLAEMVRLQQFEDIDATGSLSGALPINIGPSGVTISNGKASADAAGGYVRYRPKDGGAAMRSASMETEMLLKALDDYQYSELQADAAYRPDGQLTLQLSMKGRSPGLHETRPLHLNLNLDQNILSLIKSLRAVNGLNDRIDRAVKQHFKARNR